MLIFAAPSLPGQIIKFKNEEDQPIMINFTTEGSPFDGDNPFEVPAVSSVDKRIANGAKPKDYPFWLGPQADPNFAYGEIGVTANDPGEDGVTLVWNGKKIVTTLSAGVDEAVNFVVQGRRDVFVEFPTTVVSPLKDNSGRLPKLFPVNGLRNTKMALDPSTSEHFPFKSNTAASLANGPTVQQSGGSDLGDLIAIPPV